MKRHKRLILYIVLLALVLITMFLLRVETSDTYEQRDLADIQEEGVLRIVTDYSPLTYYVSGDTLIGFDYELSRLLSKRSGLRVEIYPEVSLSKSLEGLATNKYDIVGRPLPVTTENKQNYNFTDPIQLNKQVLIQRKADFNNGKKPIRNQLGLARKKLRIISDAPTKLRIINLAHEIGDTIYIEEETVYGAEQLIIMVAKGEIEFAVCDEATAQEMSEHYPEIDYQTDISFTQFQSWALRKNSPVLLDSINIWLKDIKDSESFKKLKQKYYLSAK